MPVTLTWSMPPCDEEQCIYLTFDDGPHPKATTFVLDQLAQFNAKATFFCIGKNVVNHPEIYQRILSEGHTTGNHTHNHKNGWKTKKQEYAVNTSLAARHIKSKLFRPPYGRITRSQANYLTKEGYAIYMWDVLSADFDTTITPEQCLSNVLKNMTSGSVIVFHDSEKAWERMSYALPELLKYCRENNWQLKALPKK